jgi:hypothetical protein
MRRKSTFISTLPMTGRLRKEEERMTLAEVLKRTLKSMSVSREWVHHGRRSSDNDYFNGTKERRLMLG